MYLKPKANTAKTVNGLTRDDVLCIARADRLEGAKLLSEAVKTSGNGYLGESIPAATVRARRTLRHS